MKKLNIKSTKEDVKQYLSELAKSSVSYHIDDDVDDIIFEEIDFKTKSILKHNSNVMWEICNHKFLWDAYYDELVKVGKLKG